MNSWWRWCSHEQLVEVVFAWLAAALAGTAGPPASPRTLKCQPDTRFIPVFHPLPELRRLNGEIPFSVW